MKVRVLIFVFLFELFFVFSGCTKKPADFPLIYSCLITVVNNDKPIEGATVTLNYETIGAVTVTAITDSRGIAKIKLFQSSYSAVGAPVGKAKILLRKMPFVPDTRTEEEKKGKSIDEEEAYKQSLLDKADAMPREIPDSLGIASTTPLTIEIQNKPNILTIDISKYIQEKSNTP
ncbi:MAG: Ig-like domain-containing protein [Planctomycetaceae bacterium]|jgi:hypothetical protein|nr:Ig-like domain-containing protein [Planctomycetaceae bacterium]